MKIEKFLLLAMCIFVAGAARAEEPGKEKKDIAVGLGIVGSGLTATGAFNIVRYPLVGFGPQTPAELEASLNTLAPGEMAAATYETTHAQEREILKSKLAAEIADAEHELAKLTQSSPRSVVSAVSEAKRKGAQVAKLQKRLDRLWEKLHALPESTKIKPGKRVVVFERPLEGSPRAVVSGKTAAVEIAEMERAGAKVANLTVTEYPERITGRRLVGVGVAMLAASAALQWDTVRDFIAEWTGKGGSAKASNRQDSGRGVAADGAAPSDDSAGKARGAR